MKQQHDQHEHHEDDRPSGQTRRSFLYSLSLGGVLALAACGGSPTATSAPRASTAASAAPSAAPSAAGSAAPSPAASPAAGASTPASSTAASGTPASGTPAGGTPIAGGATPVPSCVLTPDETEGPYYFNAAQVRRNITEGKPGTPLVLTFTVVDVNKNCQPIRDMLVDVWHCDATGNYSGFSGTPNGPAEGTPGARPGGTPPGGFPGGAPSGTPGTFPGFPGGTPPSGGFPSGGSNPTPNVATAEKFLRGIQTTDANGQATFETIFPGWYQGRLTHVHFKIHLDDKTTFTSQFFTPDAVQQQVYANDDPYKARGQNPTTVANDSVVHSEAERAPLLMTASRSGSTILGNFVVGLKR